MFCKNVKFLKLTFVFPRIHQKDLITVMQTKDYFCECLISFRCIRGSA